MGNYSRSGWGLDRLTQGVAVALASAVLAACATTAEPPPPPAPPSPPAAPVATGAPVFAAALPAGPVSMRDDAPLIYTVKKGDTLWGIANKFLRDPWQWPEVWYVNDQVKNPHKIYPGDVLRLVYVNGRPQLASGRTSGIGVERLSPQVRELPLEGAIPMIPIDAIRQFLHGPRLVTAEELSASPYVLAFADEHLAGGAGIDIYVQNLKADQGFNYAVMRRGEIYRDPDNGDLLGYEAIPVGDAEVQEYGQPATALLARTTREALIGDRLLPVEPEAFSENFFPRAPEREINGRIISVSDGFSEIGQFQIVAMNRGSNHGLEPGHVLDILQAGRSAKDPYSIGLVALPEIYAGQLLVFKVTPRVSFGLVMSVTRAVHKLDKVEKPVPGRR